MYNNPALYDACTAHKIDDIPFYENWANDNGTILELACGTGRIAKHNRIRIQLYRPGFEFGFYRPLPFKFSKWKVHDRRYVRF